LDKQKFGGRELPVVDDCRLDRDDSATIGFVVACPFREAINVEELRGWADHVLLSAAAYPNYVTELSLFDGYLKDVFSVIGFVPSRGLSDGQELAVTGMAFARGREPFDSPASRAVALAALGQHPEVSAEFRRTFPFLTVGK
jgi:hypothetical protein